MSSITRLIQVLHVLTSGELVAQLTVQAHQAYLLVPASCGHCADRPPFTVPPAEGFDAAVVFTHDRTCPRVRGVVGQRRGG